MKMNDYGRELSMKKSLALNLAANFITYVVVFGINFFLSPYIVRTVGVEAYGFVSLANSFISYASLATVALNALAGRFITIKIRKKDFKSANRYYTSVFFGNAVISFVLLCIAIVVWAFLEKIIKIPTNILWDVKWLFAALFVNGILSTFTSVFSVATFATNRLYLSSIRSIEANVIRAIVIILLFVCLSPRVCYLGLTTLIAGIYSAVFNYHYVRRLTPYLVIHKRYFDKNAVKELMSAGVWSLITRIGQILADGLDLLITNLLIDATSMGILSLAKTVPGVITGIVGNLVGVFSPNFTILYAEKKHKELVCALNQSMKIMGVICNIPIIVLVVCGTQFFSLWQPTQDAKQLQILSILTCAGLIINGGINCIYDIFTVVNKLKFNSIVLVVSSFLSVATTYLLLKTTSLGIYAVAGVSTVIMMAKNIILIVPYAAKCIGLRWYSFYGNIVRQIVFVAVCVAVCYYPVHIFGKLNWLNLAICAFLTGLVSLMIGICVILNRSDRKKLVEQLSRLAKRKG